MRKAVVSFFKSSVVKSMLRGMGGAAVAALGWKLASDVYDGVKARVTRKQAEEDEQAEEKEEPYLP